MAYEKQTWNTGDLITEEKLNHMEDGIATGGGIYSVNEMYLFDGEVTTIEDGGVFPSAIITLQGDLPKSDISVTFNGENYTLPYVHSEEDGEYWGEVGETDPSFTNFPVYIDILFGATNVMTAETGTYSLKINEKVQKFEVNDSFTSALGLIVEVDKNPIANAYTLNKKYSEIYSAVLKGQNVIFIGATNSTAQGTVYLLAKCLEDRIHLLEAQYNATFDTFNVLNFGFTNEDGYPTTGGVN